MAAPLERDGEELGGLGVCAGACGRDTGIACAASDPVDIGGAEGVMRQHRRVCV